MQVRHGNITRPPSEGFASFCEKLSNAHFEWNWSAQEAVSFRGRISSQEYDGVILTSVQVDPIRGWREKHQINAETDNRIGLTLYRDGSQLFRQDRQEVMAGRGEIVLWDGMRQSHVLTEKVTDCLSIFFPRDMVDQHIGHVDDLCGRKVGPETGAGKLLGSLIESLYDTAHLIPAASRPAIFRSVLDMIGSCFRPNDMMMMRTDYQRALVRRIEDYIRDNVHRALEPADIAAEFGFSTRYLHRLFAEAGTTFSNVIRKERLARAARMLSSSAFATESITVIALRLGFCDSAYFSKVFKAHFGQSPLQFRIANRTAN